MVTLFLYLPLTFTDGEFHTGFKKTWANRRSVLNIFIPGITFQQGRICKMESAAGK